jgi:hypothetical protein
MLHGLPCSRHLFVGHHWRDGIMAQFSQHTSGRPYLDEVPPDVTTGRVVVVVGGWVVGVVWVVAVD